MARLLPATATSEEVCEQKPQQGYKPEWYAQPVQMAHFTAKSTPRLIFIPEAKKVMEETRDFQLFCPLEVFVLPFADTGGIRGRLEV